MHDDDLDSYIASAKAEMRARETKVSFETTLEFVRRFEGPISSMVDDCGVSSAVSHINAFFSSRFPAGDATKTKPMLGIRSFTKALRDLADERTKASKEKTNASEENHQSEAASSEKTLGKSKKAKSATDSASGGQPEGQQSLGIS